MIKEAAKAGCFDVIKGILPRVHSKEVLKTKIGKRYLSLTQIVALVELGWQINLKSEKWKGETKGSTYVEIVVEKSKIQSIC